MTYGFRIFNADGSVQIDSDSIGILFIDDFIVTSGSVTNTYAGLGAANVTVMADPTDTMSAGATITQAVVGNDMQVTVAVQRGGRFRVMVE